LATASLIVGLAAVGVPFLVRTGAHENRDVDGALSLYKAALSLAVAGGLLVILLCVAAFRLWRRSRAGGLRIVLALSLACLLVLVEAPMMLLTGHAMELGRRLLYALRRVRPRMRRAEATVHPLMPN
jgi:hypothetical protein